MEWRFSCLENDGSRKRRLLPQTAILVCRLILANRTMHLANSNASIIGFITVISYFICIPRACAELCLVYIYTYLYISPIITCHNLTQGTSRPFTLSLFPPLLPLES